MQELDWIILSVTLLFIVAYGVYKTKGSKDVNDYILGKVVHNDVKNQNINGIGYENQSVIFFPSFYFLYLLHLLGIFKANQIGEQSVCSRNTCRQFSKKA